MSIFSHIKVRRNKRRNFNLGHEVKFTADFGSLIPVYWNYFEPTAVFRYRPEIMCRVAPMLAPIMHRVNVYYGLWKIPCRLNVANFEDYITGGPEGKTEVLINRLLVPEAYNYMISSGTLADYLGVPMNDAGDYEFDAPAFLAYQSIYDNYFRDQNLEDSLQSDIDLALAEGTHTCGNTAYDPMLKLRKVSWEKDYFTSALPFAQRGDPVNIPVSGGDVELELYKTGLVPKLAPTKLRKENSNAFTGFTLDGADEDSDSLYTFSDGDGSLKIDKGNGSSTNQGAIFDVTGNTKGVIKNLNATINDLRTATRVQRWLERNAVGGARYIEQILAHFPGARNLDARLQRPEYIGGGRIPVVMSEVLQTSESTDASAQATMAGRGVAMGAPGTLTTKCDEHCIIMALMWVRPKSSYQQGMPRKLHMRDKFDFPWPEFGNLGEQEVKNEEVYYVPDSLENTNDDTWGYQSRYAQYKFEPNRVHGAFKDTMNFWHLGRIFDGLPELSKEFCSVDDDNLNRIFAVENDGYLASDLNHFWFQVYNNIKCNRPLPYYGTPI